ncbi:MAG: VOC family protein [Gammaproteobacteria bacterium]|nr:VOC family protein [Gammaproteobacteria bacterium]MDH5692122.1 VOC family protein [Gammaproteobacteria bacterium]
MSASRPTHLGLRHVALYVQDLQACERFYVDLFGMHVEWRPDEDNVYLCSGCDNLALHKAASPLEGFQKLDHIGFIVKTMDEVDQWFEFLVSHDVKIRNQPRTHRDGARSFYCFDPDGTVVQVIFHPPISGISVQ